MVHQHVVSAPGESAPFHFDSTWRVNAAPDDVWSLLAEVDSWSDWWPGMVGAITGTPNQQRKQSLLGTRVHAQVTSHVGFSLDLGITLTQAEPGRFVQFSATGDLRGTGQWTFARTGPLTEVSILWCVTTRRPLLRMLRPLAGWTHSHVMTAGNRGLNALLNRDDRVNRSTH